MSRCNVCGRFAKIIDSAKVNCTRCGYGAPLYPYLLEKCYRIISRNTYIASDKDPGIYLNIDNRFAKLKPKYALK